jgi:glycosyltransferase involved in cell wall biosynthesis
LVEKSPLREQAKLLGYRPHDESVAWLKSADLLFLPNHTPLDGGPALIVPGKTYEYLAAGRPILAMGPTGDMREFVERCGAGICCDGADVASASEALKKFYDAKIRGVSAITRDTTAIESFNRRTLAEKLAKALDSVA